MVLQCYRKQCMPVRGGSQHVQIATPTLGPCMGRLVPKSLCDQFITLHAFSSCLTRQIFLLLQSRAAQLSSAVQQQQGQLSKTQQEVASAANELAAVKQQTTAAAGELSALARQLDARRSEIAQLDSSSIAAASGLATTVKPDSDSGRRDSFLDFGSPNPTQSLWLFGCCSLASLNLHSRLLTHLLTSSPLQ